MKLAIQSPGHSFLVSVVASQYVGEVVVVVIGRGRLVGFGVDSTRVSSQQTVSSAQFEVLGIITAGLSQFFFFEFEIQYPGHRKAPF